MQPRLRPGVKPVSNPPAFIEHSRPRYCGRGHGAPLLARFLGKFVLDIMPAALASVIGGFLCTQYQFGHKAPQPVLEQVTPASAEMMALVRDEHAMITDYLKSQMAAEKSRVAKQDADLARAAEDARLAEDKAADSKPAVDIRAAVEVGPRHSRPPPRRNRWCIAPSRWRRRPQWQRPVRPWLSRRPIRAPTARRLRIEPIPIRFSPRPSSLRTACSRRHATSSRQSATCSPRSATSSRRQPRCRGS